MSTSLVTLTQSKKNDYIKTAYCPGFYKDKVIVDAKDSRVQAIDRFGQTVIFKPNEIYFTEDEKNYTICESYCNSNKIDSREFFRDVKSITFLADEKRVVPVLSSIKVINISKK